MSRIYWHADCQLDKHFPSVFHHTPPLDDIQICENDSWGIVIAVNTVRKITTNNIIRLSENTISLRIGLFTGTVKRKLSIKIQFQKYDNSIER